MIGMFDGTWNALLSLGDGVYSNVAQFLGYCSGGTCPTISQTVWSEFTAGASAIGNVLGSVAAHTVINLLYFFPDGGTMPTAFHDAAIYFGNALQTVAWLVPIPTLIYCMTFAFGVKLTLWSFHVVRVIVNFVRGVPTEPFDMPSEYAPTVTLIDSSGRRW